MSEPIVSTEKAWQWSLEIRIERIFNNLIKQNQKLGPDFVVQQSTTVSKVQSPDSSVQSPVSSVQSPASTVQRPQSSVQGPVSGVQHPESSVQSSASGAQHAESRNSGMPLLLKRLKYFEVMGNIFEFSWVWENVETWLVYSNKLFFNCSTIFLEWHNKTKLVPAFFSCF